MTEEPDESPLRPAEDQRIRALLADLGSGPDGESMPPEVAARLDATLARLVAEREAAGPEESGAAESGAEESGAVESGGSTRGATVVPLRRRWATRGAAAAAAVIVVAGGGVAAANLGLLGGATTADSSSGGSSSASSAERSLGAGAEDLATPSPGQDSAGDRRDGGDAVAKDAVPALTAASFRGQVTTLLGDSGGADLSAPSTRGLRREVTVPLVPSAPPSTGAPDAGGSPSGDPGSDPGSDPGTATPSPTQVGSCVSPPLTDGARVTAITFDSAPAVLVVHPGVRGRQLVEAWSCSGSQRLAQTRVATAAVAP